MSTLLQISDTHFGTERPQVIEALLALAREVAPKVIVISGDITQRARRAQFAAAGRFVDRLPPAPVLAIPGNHDIPLFNVAARAFFPYRGYSRVFGELLEPRLDLEGFSVICVNTTRPARHKDGEVSPAQVLSVSHALRECPAERLRIVVTHQPVHAIRDEDEDNILHGRDAAVRSWVNAGADIFMGGHIHLPYVRPMSEALSDLPRRAWVVQAGTATSHRIRDGISNSVNVLRHDPSARRAYVERWDFQDTGAAFARVRTETLVLDRPAAV